MCVEFRKQNFMAISTIESKWLTADDDDDGDYYCFMIAIDQTIGNNHYSLDEWRNRSKNENKKFRENKIKINSLFS